MFGRGVQNIFSDVGFKKFVFPDDENKLETAFEILQNNHLKFHVHDMA